MGKYIPSLSEQGWVTDPAKILNHQVAYYILTDTGQSLAFQGNLTSLPHAYFEFINDPEGMADRIINDLQKVLGRYFQEVEVTCETKALTESRYGILLYVAVLSEENTKVELSRVINMGTSGLRKVIEVANYGDARNTLYSLV